MESQLVLEAWLVESAPKIRREPGGPEWIVADPTLSPFSNRTFWRLLIQVVTRCKLERVRSNIFHPVCKRSRMATLVRGQMHTRARDCATLAVNGTTDSIGIQSVQLQQIKTTSHSCVRFAHECESFGKIQAGASGKKMSESESTREKAAKWATKQSKDDGGAQDEMVELLLAAKQTKARVADLWKVLFSFAGHGFGHNPGVKEKSSLFAWAKEFDEHFPDPDIKFGAFLRDVFLDYSKCRSYVLDHTTWKEANDKPNVAWLYYNRDHVLAWWLSSAKDSKFKGATLS